MSVWLRGRRGVQGLSYGLGHATSCFGGLAALSLQLHEGQAHRRSTAVQLN